MRRLAVVFVGGGLGSVLRAALLAWLAPGGAPAPVLLVNLLGAFMLGIVYVLADEVELLHPTTRFFLAVGVLGGFTTFSTFIWGADPLIARPTWDAAFYYLVASVGGGVVTVVVGLAAGREMVLALERGAVALLARLEAQGHRRTGEVARVVDSLEAENREDTRLLTDGNHQELA